MSEPWLPLSLIHALVLWFRATGTPPWIEID